MDKIIDELMGKMANRAFYRELDTYCLDNKTVSSIRIANGLLINHAFPPWFTDHTAAMRQVLNYRLTDLDIFPGFKNLAKTLGKQSIIGSVITGMTATEKALEEPTDYWFQIFKTLSKINITQNNEIDLLKSDLFKSLLNKQSVDIKAFNQPGIAQYQRNLQNQFRGYAIQALGQAWQILLKLCVKFDWEIQIRPTIAQSSSFNNSIHSAALHNAFYDIGKYRTVAQIALHDSLKANGLGGMLLDSYDYSESADYANILRELYWNFWLDGCYMRLRKISNPELTIQIAPKSLPPTFLGTKGDKMPINVLAPRMTFIPCDWIYMIYLCDANDAHIVELHDDVINVFDKARNLLPIITSCLTLISLTMNLGSGNHKPRWTQAIYNTEFMRALPLALVANIFDALH